MKKLFLCDIDGTLMDGSRDMKHMSPKTKYAINELSKDNYVLIASGRCKGLLAKEILELPVNGYILCNGAYAEVNNKVLFEKYFDQNAVNKIIDCSLNNNGFYVLESLHRMFVNDLRAQDFINFLNGWGQTIEGFEQRPDLSHRYHIAMIGFDNGNDALKCEEELSQYVDVRRHNGYHSSDVNIKGIDKGVAAKVVIEKLGINIEDTYCFGDGINDLEMLNSVGHPVIMANCDPILKQYNFEKTLDVLNDGFYHYLLDNKLIKAM